MWATADESTEFIVGHYRRTCTESDKVIADFRLEDTGSRWKGDPISLRQAIVSMIGETARHAGHADIIRELIDGSASCHPGQPESGLPRVGEQGWWQDYVARVEQVAASFD